METVITAGNNHPYKLYKVEKYTGILMILSFFIVYLVHFFPKNDLSVITFAIFLFLGLISCLLLFILAIIHFFIAMKSDGLGKFTFADTNFVVHGLKINPDTLIPVISNEPISYNEFTQVRLNLNLTGNSDGARKQLELLTDSDRSIIAILIDGYSKDSIEQILRTFQKKGKLVHIAPELAGIYSVGNANGEVM